MEFRAVERKRQADDAFLQFWEAYPKKVARVAAVKAWQKLRPDAALVEAILDALEWQCQQWDDRQFVPYPASYLNGRRWEDERPQSLKISPAGQSVLRVLSRGNT